MTDEDRLLPIANVGRMMKQVLPPSAKISKEAKQTMQECATEFISFVTGEASDKCHKENRKTVNGDDICWALSALGLDNYAEAIMLYLHKYREAERQKANTSNKGSESHDRDEEGEGSVRRDNLQASRQAKSSTSSFGHGVLEKGSCSATRASS